MVREEKPVAIKTLFTYSSIIIWITVFTIAFASRVAFIDTGDQLPVFWDSRIYTSAAIGLIGYCDQVEPFAHGDNSGEGFKRYYLESLDGEDIHWLYYTPPSLAESQKYLFYSGPVYPAMMAVVFSFDWGNDFQAVRYLNALMDSLTIVMLAMIAFLLWGRAFAIFAAVIQLLYIPSILTCGILALETVTSFFITAFLLSLILYDRTENTWWVLAAGFLGGILFLTKPTAALLSVPVGIYWLILYRKRLRFVLQSVLWYALPFLLLVVPWIIFTSSYYGKPAIRDPEYASANFRSSSSIQFEGYDLDFTDPDFWTYNVAGSIVSDPLGYINLLSKKLIRLWWTPHDEFRQGPQWIQIRYHRILVILALCGAAVAAAKGRGFILLPLLIALYYTGVHTIFHSVPRYNFNAMPAVFLLVPYFIYSCNLIKDRVARRKRRLAGVYAPFVHVIIFSSIRGSKVLYLVPDVVMIVVIIGLLFLGCWNAIKYFRDESMSRKRRWALWAPFVILSLTTITGWTRDFRSEFVSPLRDEETRLVTEIDLPSDFQVAVNDKVYLAIDMTSEAQDSAALRVQIGDWSRDIRDWQSPFVDNYLIKGSYSAFGNIWHLDPRRERWYRMISLSPETINALVLPRGKLSISMQAIDLAEGDVIDLYGDKGAGEGSSVIIPSFSHTSIERLKEWGDRRIYEKYALSSISSQSYIITPSGDREYDLSPSPGTQKGRLRVYLLVYAPDFTRYYY